jgi:hypothetical protein
VFESALRSEQLVNLDRLTLSFYRDYIQEAKIESVIIYFKDLDSRFIAVNRSLLHRFGKTDPAERVGKVIHQCLQQRALLGQR